MKTYRLAAVGRRTTLIMMIAAILLWVFALWMLPSTLGVRILALRSTLAAAISAGFGVSQLIQAAILIVMIVSAPLLLWALWEEWNTSYTVGEDGFTYRTTGGVVLHYPWSHVRELRTDEGDTAELIVSNDGIAPIRQSWRRWLHRQGYDLGRIPIYAGIEARGSSDRRDRASERNPAPSRLLRATVEPITFAGGPYKSPDLQCIRVNIPLRREGITNVSVARSIIGAKPGDPKALVCAKERSCWFS